VLVVLGSRRCGVSRDATPSPGSATANGTATRSQRAIGHYRIVAEKGTGAFGTVYFADDSRTGRPVAIRLLPRGMTDSAAVAATLRRRARSVIEASQTHPALIRVLEYGNTDDGQVFAVMERAEGRRLSDVLADSSPDVTATLQLAIELGGPLETLHNQGLVHAAVRPDNFVITEHDGVKLLDVELVALRDVPALHRSIVEGSPAAYLAPEQIEGQPASEKSDVYAFGVLLYQMLAGVPPFEASGGEAFVDDPQEAPRLLSQRGLAVPVSAEAALVEALDKVPERRPFMQKVLNQLATDKSASRGGWKRIAVPAAGLIAAVFIGVPVLWSLLVPRPEAHISPFPAAVKSPPIIPAGASGPSTSLPPTVETVPATLELPPRPSAPAPRLPSAGPSITPPSVAIKAIVPPIAGNPAVTPWRPIAPPTARTTAPAEPRIERQAPQPVPLAASVSAPAPAPALPVVARDHDDGDPRAIIDWLLNQRGGSGEPDGSR
jgi:eukaryotic-like serine/threonine-protein kinase